MSCPATCTTNYAAGTTVTLTATTNSGVSFSGWTGCDSATGSTCTVAMSNV
ncbi:MAG: InlB B-repeat-containing protein [Actinomycetes bacterium]